MNLRAGRVVLLVVATSVLGVVGAQFEHAIASDVALARELERTRTEVADLARRKVRDEREITRLLDPVGAIPELHARLHDVGPHEELIYVRTVGPHDAPLPRATP